MFHLIGVAHPIQSYEPGHQLNEGQGILSECLIRLIDEVKLAVIGEEQSQEALGERISIPREVAQKAGIESRFCDPDSIQRQAMGYRDRQAILQDVFLGDDGWNLSAVDLDAKAGAIEIVRYFPLREQYWLERLTDQKHSETAFVCGNAHIESFTDLLTKNGIPSRVVKRGIAVNQEDGYRTEIALAYLEKHPELRSG